MWQVGESTHSGAQNPQSPPGLDQLPPVPSAVCTRAAQHRSRVLRCRENAQACYITPFAYAQERLQLQPCLVRHWSISIQTPVPATPSRKQPCFLRAPRTCFARHIARATPQSMTTARLSCRQCQARKRRCDKRSPCASCELAGMQCVPLQRKRLPRGRSGLTQRRLASLSSQLGQLPAVIGTATSAVERAAPSRVDARGELQGAVAPALWDELVDAERMAEGSSCHRGLTDDLTRSTVCKPSSGTPKRMMR